MITLICLLEIWFAISIWNIRKRCANKEFNPFEGSLLEFFGFIVGFATNFLIVIYLTSTYLP